MPTLPDVRRHGYDAVVPEYRRAYCPGGTFFLTLATHQRHDIFASTQNIGRLRRIMAAVRGERPFEIVAAVILPDHLHFLWMLPEGDADFSCRVGRVKALFTRAMREESAGRASPAEPQSASRSRHRESDLWQRRSWEHTIRDETDWRHHMDYIHYNPVKHVLARCPHAWPHSSFHHWVKTGGYDPDWCCVCRGAPAIAPYPRTFAPGE